MPEIAEVETVRRTLLKRIIHKKITSIDIIYPGIIENDLNYFKENLINDEFIDIKRIGKWLIFETNNKYLLSHLRMEGKYFIKDKNLPIEKHEHIIFYFDDSSTLRYHDTRKFGKMILINKEDLYTTKEISKQGIEPLSNKLSSAYLLNNFKNKKIPIKTILLDQTIISGLGNIYADEVLFSSNINPLKKACDITKDEADRIIDSSNSIISKAIECGGTTIKSYTSSLGVYGSYQEYLCVHRKTICPICNSKIERIKVGGRSTYFCPNCQK